MEFLALLTWLLLAGVGMILVPIAFGTLHAGAPGAGLAALAALGGLTVCILFIVLDAPDWAGWAQVGLALLGIVGGTVAAATLLNERNVSGSSTEELQAGLVGLLLPFFGAVAFISLLLAVQAVDPVV